jgi:hypothetical protein
MKVKAALALLYKILDSVNPFDRAESNPFPPISMRRENESGACHKASSRDQWDHRCLPRRDRPVTAGKIPRHFAASMDLHWAGRLTPNDPKQQNPLTCCGVFLAGDGRRKAGASVAILSRHEGSWPTFPRSMAFPLPSSTVKSRCLSDRSMLIKSAYGMFHGVDFFLC